MQKIKALVLLSGGLDSMLAARTLIEQGVEVTGLTFVSNFFGAKNGQIAAEKLNVKHLVVDFKAEHLAMTKDPEYGYGKNMNPCIDCHSMMLRQAKKIMEDEGFDFVATGEVLGQRPMSQTKVALKIVAKFSGLGDRLVRPLSAQLLDLTAPEKEGKINREALLALSGRSRAKQKELAVTYGLTDYPTPAGGCLLTDPVFGERLKLMFTNWPECTGEDVALLRQGRQFWLKLKDDNVLVVIGRDQKDNEILEKLKRPNDVLIKLVDELGPTALVRINLPAGEAGNQESRIMEEEIEVIVPVEMNIEELDLNRSRTEKEIVQTIALFVGYYAKKLSGKKVKLNILR